VHHQTLATITSATVIAAGSLPSSRLWRMSV
jgi:hypothetical protein